MNTLAPPRTAPHVPRQTHKVDPRGNQHFWAALDAVAAEAKRERREYFSFDEWDFLFATVERDVAEGRGFPAFLQPALARRHQSIEEYRALDLSAEDLYRDECAQEKREAERRAQRELDDKARHAVLKLAKKSRGRIARDAE